MGGKQLQTGTADNLKNHRVFGNDGAIISMKRLFGGIIQREQSFLQRLPSHLQKMSVKIKASVAYFINQCVCVFFSGFYLSMKATLEDPATVIAHKSR